MNKLFLKIGVAVLVLASIVGGHSIQSAHASSQKFLIEQIFKSGDNIGVFFFVNDSGTLSGESQTSFTASTYSTEQDLATATKNAIATWANGNGYAGVTAADVYDYSPVLANVATTGAYSDLSGKPTLGIAYEGTTQRTNAFPIFKSTTVSSGTAVFNLTSDGTSGGTNLCPNGVIQDSVNAFVSDAAASYQMAYAFSNSNKTVTVTTNKLTTANILTGILGQSAGNGSVVKLSVYCY